MRRRLLVTGEGESAKLKELPSGIILCWGQEEGEEKECAIDCFEGGCHHGWFCRVFAEEN